MVTYEGDVAIDGVPGTAAPIRLSFLDAAGAKTGRLLPTGHARDRIGGVEASCIDMAMPMVLLRARDLGKTGHERPAELDADRGFLARLEAIRREAGALMGLGRRRRARIPKPVLLSAPQSGGTIAVRYFTPRACHRSVAATGAVGLATACVLPGSLAQELAGPLPSGPTALIVLEHPAGRIPIELELAPPGAELPVLRASLVRTARRLFAGSVFVPDPPPHPIREISDAQQARRSSPRRWSPPAPRSHPSPPRPHPTQTGRSGSSSPTPPAAGPTPSRG